MIRASSHRALATSSSSLVIISISFLSNKSFIALYLGWSCSGDLLCLALFNLLALHSAWGWLFILATPLLVKQARYVLRESDPLAMRPMLEKTVKGALLTNLLFVIGIIASKLMA